MNTFYENNRRKLTAKMKEDSFLIMLAGNAPKKTADESYTFTPNRNFLYVTGIDEPDVILLITKTAKKTQETLYIKKRDEVLAKWVGETISSEKAEEVSGISEVKYLDSFESDIHGCISRGEGKTVYLDMEKDGFETPDLAGTTFAKKLQKRYPQVAIEDVFPILSTFRMTKEPEEIEKIRKAIEITKNGIYNLMRNAQPGMKEFELEAYYDFVLKSSGVKDFAFDTICASGHNATVLHYVANDAKVLENELVLLDLGAAYEYYSADISRTFPVSGKFTERQKTFYNLVLEAQQAAIDALRPGLPYAEINKIVLRVYAERLKELGLIDKDEDVRKYYYHNTSHHLGLNTHDVGSRDLELQEGMVITIEPGLYIAEENIGIRIEEDVLITKDGHEVLSKDIIKSVEEIEAFLTHSKLVKVK